MANSDSSSEPVYGDSIEQNGALLALFNKFSLDCNSMMLYFTFSLLPIRQTSS